MELCRVLLLIFSAGKRHILATPFGWVLPAGVGLGLCMGVSMKV